MLPWLIVSGFAFILSALLYDFRLDRTYSSVTFLLGCSLVLIGGLSG